MGKQILRWLVIFGVVVFIAQNPHQAAGLISKLFGKVGDIVEGLVTFLANIKP